MKRKILDYFGFKVQAIVQINTEKNLDVKFMVNSWIISLKHPVSHRCKYFPFYSLINTSIVLLYLGWPS